MPVTWAIIGSSNGQLAVQGQANTPTDSKGPWIDVD